MEVAGAEGVRGVGGARCEGSDEVVEGVRVALVRQDVPGRLPHACGDRVRAARGQWSPASPGALAQRVEDGVEQRPQSAGTFRA
ncbi:hypothetical protein ADL12_15380 [Streptomyces regalis]|uniref:Uncharacterized protein n=1 Tax=Streptomyces regalis TaxID=68262 RepID=A0A0X3V413_9ACTN|nr:hypothetical protein ADL12_15380 [Streptomyces regalis]